MLFRLSEFATGSSLDLIAPCRPDVTLWWNRAYDSYYLPSLSSTTTSPSTTSNSYVQDLLTVPASLTGLPPCLALVCGARAAGRGGDRWILGWGAGDDGGWEGGGESGCGCGCGCGGRSSRSVKMVSQVLHLFFFFLRGQRKREKD